MFLTRLGILVLLVEAAIVSKAIEPNYEEVDDSLDQPNGAKTNIDQQSPNSNTIHVAHNIPKNSDISLKQTDAYNSTVHISLNIGDGCKVNVDISGAVNCQYHVSFNTAKNSECTVKVDRAFNTTVHLSFQNPANTPVKLEMDSPRMCQIHVSQNVPYNSPVDVKITSAINNSIHASQSAPKSSPFSVDIDGNPESNAIEISQNSPDEGSPLTCKPDCPQKDYEEEEDDYNNASPDRQSEKTNYFVEYDHPGVDEESSNSQELVPDQISLDYPDQDLPGHTKQQPLILDSYPQQILSSKPCPGIDIDECIDVCPYDPPLAYRYCVAECGRRCP